MTDDHTSEVQEQYALIMKRLGRAIDQFINPDAILSTGRVNPKLRTAGFVLLMFQLGDTGADGRMNYISNSKRADILASLKELVGKMENDPAFQEAEP